MKKIIFIISFIFCITTSNCQVTLNANGNGNTYALITSVLAPGNNPIETPDCSHNAFGNHIDEVFDAALNDYAFRFFIHSAVDNDRCISFDRQRNEIKTYNSSPANLLGIENEIVQYKWKFKLPAGFQSSSNFTHIHQLKSVGDTYEDTPMITFTTRKGTPDKLELRYAAAGTQSTIYQTSLVPFLDTWVEATETVTYANPGTYSIVIKNVSDGTVLFNYSNNSINTWRAGASFLRPKWGIYRSLLNVQDLRDEEVLFANFSIQELTSLNFNTNQITPNFTISSIPKSGILEIKNISNLPTTIELFSIDGKKIIQNHIPFDSSFLKIDVSTLPNGNYIVIVSNNDTFKQTQKISIQN